MTYLNLFRSWCNVYNAVIKISPISSFNIPYTTPCVSPSKQMHQIISSVSAENASATLSVQTEST